MVILSKSILTDQRLAQLGVRQPAGWVRVRASTGHVGLVVVFGDLRVYGGSFYQGGVGGDSAY